MKDRIIQIMDAKGLMPSRFAEEIGIQRAAMSHITSGRNNPSLDVVTKILERFPDINPKWLLFGSGEMKQHEINGNSTVSSSKQSMNAPDLFANPPKDLLRDEQQAEYYRKIPSSDKKTYYSHKNIEKENAAKDISVRKVEKIMIFYSDSTYEIFNPEKNR